MELEHGNIFVPTINLFLNTLKMQLKHTVYYFKKVSTKTLFYSPDVSPIKNICRIFKQKIHQR